MDPLGDSNHSHLVGVFIRRGQFVTSCLKTIDPKQSKSPKLTKIIIQIKLYNLTINQHGKSLQFGAVSPGSAERDILAA